MKKVGRKNLLVVLFVGLACWCSLAAQAGELTDSVTAADIPRAEALISSGANVNELGNFGTPLHIAAAQGSVEIAKLLIDAGANVEAEAAQGRKKAHPLRIAVFSNRAAVVALLIEHGAKVDARTSQGFTPLMIAASSGYAEVAELLLKAGADPNVEDSVEHDMPIHLAAMNAHINVIELLLSKGVSVNAQNSHTGETPLWVAAMDSSMEGRLAVMEFLLSHGADPNIANNSGKAPIHAAANPKAKDLLIRFGARD